MANIPVTRVLRKPMRSAIVGAMVDSGIMMPPWEQPGRGSQG
jgi:hypothetical protein